MTLPNRPTLLALLLALTSLPLQPLHAQERGYWKPSNPAAKSTTGDLTFNGEKLTIDFFSLPIALIRPLKPAEIAAAFDGADTQDGIGHLYRLSIPGDHRFLHKNTLCGDEEVQWMATFVSGKSLGIVFFSNANPPLFTPEGLTDNVNLCGTFSYTR